MVDTRPYNFKKYLVNFTFKCSVIVIHQAEPEGLPTEVKGDSLLLLGTLLCGLHISCMGPTPDV